MDELKRIIIGVGHSPRVVATARAFLLYAVPIGLQLLIGYLAGLTDPKWLGVPLASIPFIRAVGEAILDELNKPEQNRIDPPKVAGGGSRDLLT